MSDITAAAPEARLVRALGVWGLAASIVNVTIGGGIFRLPASAAAALGRGAPLAYLVCALAMGLIVLCIAEAGSRVSLTGGPYAYVELAFGPFVGFLSGVLLWLLGTFAVAAVSTVFAISVGRLVPALGTPTGSAALLAIAFAVVATVNIRGVRQGTRLNTVTTVAKLLPLALLVLVGVWVVRPEVLEAPRVAEPNWTEAVLLLVFAYGGFESGVVAAGEVREPRRDTAFALVVAMGVVTVVYTLVQLVIVGVLPAAARSTAPVADALGRVLGGGGVMVGALAVVVSVYGWMAGFALMTPRILLAMAQRGEMPAVLARVHPDRRTPHPAIVANSVVALALALFATFAQMATLAAVVRLGIYAATCATLIALRRRAVAPPGFRLPAGDLLALVGIAFCGWLLATRSLTQAWALAGIVGSGALVRLAVRRRPV